MEPVVQQTLGEVHRLEPFGLELSSAHDELVFSEVAIWELESVLEELLEIIGVKNRVLGDRDEAVATV